MVNGVVGAVSLLRKGLIEQGHDVYIFAPAFDKYEDDERGIYRYHSVDLTREVKYPVAIPFSPRINHIVDQLHLDIVHCHHPFVLGPLAYKLARRKKIPSIYTFHTQYEQYSHYIPLPSKLVNWLSRNQIVRFCQKVTRITTPAESARQLLVGYGITHPVQVIPNPTVIRPDLEDGAAIREKYHLGSAKVLINIGRIAPEKNLGLLLRSFKHMLGQAPNDELKLMIVGEGPALADLKREAGELEISEQVFFTGLVDPTEVPTYLAASDLFVMTSTSEVKPLSQLEALAAGVPIVAVAAPGANDTIIHGENGLLVTEDAINISQSVLKLLHDEAVLEKYQKAAVKTAERYAYPRIAQEYLAVYEEAIREMKKA
jgi:glycosyltransferase involved in cell wall biosynthesis